MDTAESRRQAQAREFRIYQHAECQSCGFWPLRSWLLKARSHIQAITAIFTFFDQTTETPEGCRRWLQRQPAGTGGHERKCQV